MLRTSAVCLSALLLGSGCGQRPLEPRDPDPGAFHFHIQTYNVLDEDPGDSATLDAMGQAGADVICLQETTDAWKAAIEARYADQYPYRMFKAPSNLGGASALGVLSRWPVRDGGWHAGPNGWHPAWHYLIDTPHGTMKVLNLHLRNATSDDGNMVESYLSTASDHELEARDFAAANEEVFPTIVLGDFNETASGAGVSYFESLGFTNALPLYHPGQPTCRHRSLANEFWMEIDHILFDGTFEPLNAWTVNSGGSDHFPVVAHLETLRTW